MKRFFFIPTLLVLFAMTHWACQQTYTVAPLTAGNSSSPVNNSTLGWTLSSSPVSFAPRTAQTSVVFNNKMWVIAGLSISGGTPNGLYNDTWYSTGSNWTQATANAAFSARYGHASAVYNNAIWVIAGSASGTQQNDVWSSTDGASWSPATTNAAFSPREFPTCLAYNGKLWVIGGLGTGGFMNDVWYSTNGTNWTQATANASFSGRYGHSSAVYNNAMWVIGGEDNAGLRNDAWYSTDGVNWTAATTSAAFLPRAVQSTVVFNGALWVIGGLNNLSSFTSTNDSWYSTDGANWNQTGGTPFTPARYAHTTLVYNNSMWVITGYDYPNSLSDIWHAP